MNSDITLNPNPEGCMSDGFDDRIKNNQDIKNIKNNVHACATTISKHYKRISEQQDAIDKLTYQNSVQQDTIEKLNDKVLVLQARSECARSAIESLFEIFDDEIHSSKVFSTIMCILFFISLVINIALQFAR